MNNILTQLSEKIKNEIVDLYRKSYYNLTLDKNKYNITIHHVVNAIMHQNNISMTEKFVMYCSALLYPCYNIHLNQTCENNIKSILVPLKLPQFIINKDKFIGDVIDIINITMNKDHTTNKPWKYILHDSIQLTDISPKSLLHIAIELKKDGIPLYTRYVPFIKSRKSIPSLCRPNKNYNSFIEYVYHVGLHQFTQSRSGNSYIKNTLEHYTEKMIELCLCFGEAEFITENKLNAWANSV